MAIQSLKMLLIAPAVLGIAIVSAISPAAANEVSVASLTEGKTSDLGQVTSVSQLSDVKPTDWAFQALQSLVERYGCIAGYPDKTYRGNRAMTRYEFAAGLNSCMDRVNDLIAASTADMVKKEDLATLRKLQEQFAAELATLRGRVDGLESKVATLEKQQFSTTTKLTGEVIFAVSGVLGDRKANAAGNNPARLDTNTTLSDRVRLGLSTSFTGKDTLFTRLQARNTANFSGATGTNMARLSFDGDNGNSVEVDKLYYRFPLGKARVTVDATGGEFYGNMENFNGQLASDATGSISRFGRFNPIYRYAQGGSGATINYSITPQIGFSAGYLARNANSPSDGNGLFNGGNAILAQLEYKASKNFGLGLTYVRGYDRNSTPAVLGTATTVAAAISDRPSVSGGTGSTRANRPFGDVATTSDNFGIQGSFAFSPAITLGGWAGYTSANRAAGSGNASIFNWAFNLALPDFGKKGNLAAVIVGQQPKVTGASTGVIPAGTENSTNFFVEGLYRYQMNDKISITPGLMVIFNPENNSGNTNTYIGTIRTTFRF